MKNSNTLLYVPGDYFGIDFALKMNINVDNTIIVGKLINKLNIGTHTWYEVFIFILNEKKWIIKHHLTKLPLNTNIIFGKSYINERNKHQFLIKKNINYLNNNLLELQNNMKGNLVLSNCNNIKYRYFT